MKKLYLSLIVCLALLITLSSVSAFFTPSHLYWSLKTMEADSTSGSLGDVCKERYNIVLDGNTAADVFVFHYFENRQTTQFLAYSSTHAKGSGLDQCLTLAGTDLDLKCFCYGMGFHEVQDQFSHNDGGLVAVYLKKYMLPNLGGHITIENDYTIKHIDSLKADSIVSSGELDNYNNIALQTLLDDPKYITLLSELTGFNEEGIKNDINTFAYGYRGKGFYSTVSPHLALPAQFWMIGIIGILAGFFIPIILLWLFIKKKLNLWIIPLIIFYTIIFVIALSLLISLVNNSTWTLIKFYSSLLPARVSTGDVSYYDTQALSASAEYARTLIQQYDDSTGLSYIDRYGMKHVGAIDQAQQPFNYIVFPILLGLFVVINLVLIFMSLRKRK